VSNNIETLSDKGEFLFVFSDKHNIILFFKEETTGDLYKLKCDKFREIEEAFLIEVPNELSNAKIVRFFKPYSSINDYSYGGLLKTDQGDYHKFIIDNETMFIDYNFKYSPCHPESLPAITDITISNYISKKTKMHVLGVDRHDNGNEPIYGVIDVEKNQFDKIYYIYSDKGEVILNSLNTDVQGKNVYICGCILTPSGEKLPYFETFVLPPIKE